MHQNYFKAAVPEPYRIFGLRLLPLSIGRYRLLKRFDCAFVSDEPTTASWNDLGWNDLVLGVFICSLPVKEFMALLEDAERFRTELVRWGKRIREEIAADPHFNLLAKVGLFRAYIEESSNLPKYWNEFPDDDRPAGSHWSHGLEVILRGELGYTQEEINEGPLSKALFDYLKYAETQGTIRLIGEGEEETGESNAGLLKEAFSKWGVECPA